MYYNSHDQHRDENTLDNHVYDREDSANTERSQSDIAVMFTARDAVCNNRTIPFNTVMYDFNIYHSNV